MLLNNSDAAVESARMIDDLRAALRIERANFAQLKEGMKEQEERCESPCWGGEGVFAFGRGGS